MDASPPTEQQLHRLLRLTRYEQPPPGFHDRLRRRIILHLRAGSAPAPDSLWERLTAFLQWQPLLAGSYAALAVGALLLGVGLYRAVEGEADTGFASSVGAPGGWGVASLGAMPAWPAPQILQTSPPVAVYRSADGRVLVLPALPLPLPPP